VQIRDERRAKGCSLGEERSEVYPNGLKNWNFDKADATELEPLKQPIVELARISHQHSSQFGQTVLSDAEENPEGRVKLTLPRDALKVDDETDGQSGRMVGEKRGLGAIQTGSALGMAAKPKTNSSDYLGINALLQNDGCRG